VALVLKKFTLKIKRTSVGKDYSMRFWFSGPRILWGLIRPGVSVAQSGLSPQPVTKRLPKWKRYELRMDIKETMAKEGETISNTGMPIFLMTRLLCLVADTRLMSEADCWPDCPALG
jgi:hypothetical protein